ncbi:hypothetical protein [Coleofasciculus sp. G3-WIS-01]
MSDSLTKPALLGETAEENNRKYSTGKGVIAGWSIMRSRHHESVIL